MKDTTKKTKAPAWKPETPALTIDIIIHVENKGIVLIQRKNPPLGFALPGGFVDVGETVEQAAVREAKEETGLDVTLMRQFHVYSEPGRDERMHTVSVVFIATAKGEPKAATDAKTAVVVTREDIPESLCFDHGKILDDFFSGRY